MNELEPVEIEHPTQEDLDAALREANQRLEEVMPMREAIPSPKKKAREQVSDFDRDFQW